VVLDLRLPGLTGLEVQEQLTRSRVPIPSVIVSGHDEPGIAERALAAGASAYLEKPLDESRLLAAVGAAALAGSQARQRVN
jgi:FixJ family two-component response regulator